MQLRRRIGPWSGRHRRWPQAGAVTGIAAIAVGSLAALALASSPATLSVAKGVTVKSKSENIVVNSHGLTVYTLSGETVHHLKCTKANTCLSFWFPVTVKSSKTQLTAAHGIKGKLGTLHRNGFHQVTLKGHPLYTFIGDGGKKRSANGEGIPTFHGIWHVIATSSSSPTMTGPTTTTTSSSTTTTPYYP